MNEDIGAATRADEASPDREPDTDESACRAELDRLWARGRDFSAADLAIMGGAMTWVSERHLVAAISNAGGFGVIASGSMSPELLDDRDRRDRGADPAARSAST